MEFTKKVTSIVAAGALLTLAGCQTMAPANNSSYGAPSQPAAGAYTGYGVVQSMEVVREQNTGIGGTGIGVGAVAGAVVGGILGNQVGGGRGNTVATVLGAAGGAYAGNEIQKSQQSQASAYKITVRMNNGSHQTLMQSTANDIRVGDRVRIDNGVARRY